MTRQDQLLAMIARCDFEIADCIANQARCPNEKKFAACGELDWRLAKEDYEVELVELAKKEAA